jgi:hypothetical protein
MGQKHYDLLANNNDHSVVGIVYKVKECISGDHSFTLQIGDVKLSIYCHIHMPISNKTLVEDIQSLVTLLVTVHAASLTAIYTPPWEVKCFKMVLITWKYFSALF